MGRKGERETCFSRRAPIRREGAGREMRGGEGKGLTPQAAQAMPRPTSWKRREKDLAQRRERERERKIGPPGKGGKSPSKATPPASKKKST